MKKFYFSFLLAMVSTFAFISCDKNDKIDNEVEKGEKCLTVSEQQECIKNSLSGIIETVDMTDLSQALGIIPQFMGKQFDINDLEQSLDEIPELGLALQSILGVISSDTILIDFKYLSFNAELSFTDSIAEDGTAIIKVGLEKLEPNSDGLRVALNYNGLPISLNLNGEFNDNSTITIVTEQNDEKNIKTICLPTSLQLVLSVGDKELLTINEQYNSDSHFTIDLSDKVAFSYNGTKLTFNGNVTISGNSLSTSLSYDEKKGLNIQMIASAGSNEVLTLSANLDAVLSELDFNNPSTLLPWVMNAEQFKSVDLNAKLGGGVMELKAHLDNPFKNQEFMSLVVPMIMAGNPSAENSEKLATMLNESINVELYFKGYDKPQAKLMFVAIGEQQTKAELGSLDIASVIGNLGVAPVLSVYDENGKPSVVALQDYFAKSDAQALFDTLKGKMIEVIAPILGIINN